MKTRRYKAAKGKRDRGQFLALPSTVLQSQSYARLSPHAVKLLLDIGSQYRGDNNGDLCAAWKIMQPKGWRSEATLSKAKRALLDAGFIFETRKGQRPNLCSLYALTWQTLDPSNKYDCTARGFVFGAWKANEAVPDVRPRFAVIAGTGAPLTPPAVAEAAA